MTYNIFYLLMWLVFAVTGSAQDVCVAFGSPPHMHQIHNRNSVEWKYIHTAVHIHYSDISDSLDATVAECAITDANEQFSSSKIELSLISLQYHMWTNDEGLCFPYDYAEMEEYILPLQHPMQDRLNIHVFPQFCGNILGFAFLWYQEGQDADGVYVRTDCFGVDADHLIEDRNLNATLVHELGHYFSLFHVFQGIDYCGESEDDCELVNDRVCDTAPTKLNWSCENPICPPELYGYTPNNYMDYYVDSCKTTFTAGQIERMHGVMPIWRPQIVQESPYLLGDINNDMSVDVEDLLKLFSFYGTGINTQADLNKNEIVDVFDLVELLTQYGNTV